MINESAQAKHRVAASIVCYENPAAIKTLQQALKAQSHPLNHILIIDNSKSPCVVLSADVAESCTVLHCPENIGMAKALSISVLWAKENLFDDLWLFDQDSQPEPNALEILLKTRSSIKESGKVAAIVACGILDTESKSSLNGFEWNGSRFTPLDYWHSGVESVSCDAVLHSGSLLDVEFINENDLPAFKMFIDGVDFEFCYRLKLRGLGIYIAPRSVLHHSLGRKTLVRIPWRSNPTPYFHLSPLRIYCICRNFTWLELKHSRSSTFGKIAAQRIKHCLYFALGSFFGSSTPLRGVVAACVGTFLGFFGPSFWPTQPHFKTR